MSFTKNVRVTIDSGKDLEFVPNYTDQTSSNDLISVKVSRAGQNVFSGHWSVDSTRAAILFDDPISLVSDPLFQRIARCLGIALTKALIECLWKDRGNISEIRKCIAAHATGALLDGAACVAECF